MKDQLLQTAKTLRQPKEVAAAEFSQKRDQLAAKANEVMNIWVEMLEQELSSEAFEEIYPFYHWLIVNIPIFVKCTEPDVQTG